MSPYVHAINSNTNLILILIVILIALIAFMSFSSRLLPEHFLAIVKRKLDIRFDAVIGYKPKE